MNVKWWVIVWQTSQMGYVNAAIGAIASLDVLFQSAPFTSNAPIWFPPLHAAVIAWYLGRSTTPAVGYLHVQGFTRDELWWHNLLSAFWCALAVWGPAAVLMLSPLRGVWQDVLQNPSFPYMAPAEHRFVWLALWEYAVSVPLCLYVAARWAHPARANGSGLVIAAVLLLLFFMSQDNVRLWRPDQPISGRWPLLCGGIVIAALAVLLGRQLARELEVQP